MRLIAFDKQVRPVVLNIASADLLDRCEDTDVVLAQYCSNFSCNASIAALRKLMRQASILHMMLAAPRQVDLLRPV